MLIYFLRHGDAIQSPSLEDRDRPLSTLGKKQATSAGTFLKELNIHPDSIFSSPLLRAIQTAESVRGILDVDKIQSSEYLVPGTRKEQLIAQLNQTKLKSVLLVGHEPHLSETISLLVTGREDMFVEIRKCSLACLLASESIRKGHAILQWLLTVEQMELLTHRIGPH